MKETLITIPDSNLSSIAQHNTAFSNYFFKNVPLTEWSRTKKGTYFTDSYVHINSTQMKIGANKYNNGIHNTFEKV